MKKGLSIMTGMLILLLGFAVAVEANHSWGKYHWDKSTEDVLDLRENLTTNDWEASLATSSIDWNDSVLQNRIVGGGNNTNCDPTAGAVEICNGSYGDNGWLGIASIWATRGKDNHIVQGVVKLNDYYFNQPYYNSSAWRNLVMCQEVGHTFGLDHQDEEFSNINLGTCMDYTNDPDGSIHNQLDNQHPNQHDYDELASMYAHMNEPDSGGPDEGKGNNGKGGGKKPTGVGKNIDLNNLSEWGQAIRQDAQGRNSLYERNLGNGQVIITHVLWADGHHED